MLEFGERFVGWDKLEAGDLYTLAFDPIGVRVVISDQEYFCEGATQRRSIIWVPTRIYLGNLKSMVAPAVEAFKGAKYPNKWDMEVGDIAVNSRLGIIFVRLPEEKWLRVTTKDVRLIDGHSTVALYKLGNISEMGPILDKLGVLK